MDGKGGLIRKLRGWIGPSVQSPIDLSGRKCHTVAHYRSTQLNCMRNKWLPLLLNCPQYPIPKNSIQKFHLFGKFNWVPFLHGFSFSLSVCCVFILVPDLSLRTLLVEVAVQQKKSSIDWDCGLNQSEGLTFADD